MFFNTAIVAIVSAAPADPPSITDASASIVYIKSTLDRSAPVMFLATVSATLIEYCVSTQNKILSMFVSTLPSPEIACTFNLATTPFP
ncbi:MAG: hypothetical protein QW818_03340 [Candidatus Aenigmatarchaeota archaeon]